MARELRALGARPEVCNEICCLCLVCKYICRQNSVFLINKCLFIIFKSLKMLFVCLCFILFCLLYLDLLFLICLHIFTQINRQRFRAKMSLADECLHCWSHISWYSDLGGKLQVPTFNCGLPGP